MESRHIVLHSPVKVPPAASAFLWDTVVSDMCLHNPPHKTEPPGPCRQSGGYSSAASEMDYINLPWSHLAIFFIGPARETRAGPFSFNQAKV